MLATPAIANAKGLGKRTSFDWFANAAQAGKPAAPKPAEGRKQRLVNARAAWVCSPAGFGQASRCSRR